MTRRTTTHEKARRDALVAGIWVPLAIVVATELVILGIGFGNGGSLVVHWGTGGHKQSGPWWTYAILVAAIGLPIIVGIGIFLVRATRMAGMNSWMPAISLGVTVFHCIGIGIGAVVFNDSPAAPALPIIGGVVLAVAVALLTWRFLPQEEVVPSAVAPAAAIPVKPGEVAAWTGRFTPPAALLAIIAVAIVAILTLDIVLTLTSRVHTLLLFLVPLLLFVTFITTAEFRVRATSAGLSIKSVLGWPRFTVPASDIEKAGVVEVNPMADFGGWGVRWVVGPNGKGRWGIIGRKGEALEVVRRDGRSVVITTDDAGTAASVLETYAGKAS